MRRYELSIATDYVAKWGIWEGVREVLQNAIDQETNSRPKVITYDSSGCMEIKSKHASLSKATLLLGTSTKRGNGHIGQWGEGFKLAFLCLLRTGIRVTVWTGDEIWTPRFIKSRRYGARILAVDVTKTTPKTDLTFRLEGIRPEQYADVVKKYLGFCDVGETIDTEQGRILLAEKWRGQIFVSGLYVCTMQDEPKYGYDLTPHTIELDRDRNKVRSFNLYWETSLMWGRLKDTKHATRLFEMLADKAPDVQYYNSQAKSQSKLFKEVCELSYNAFLEKHGRNAVPVRRKEDADIIREKYNELVPVILSETEYVYISSAPSMTRTGRTRLLKRAGEHNTPYRIVARVLKQHRQVFSQKAARVVEREILDPSHNWTVRK